MKRSDVILALAPSFRDRFDFSMPAQYQEWLDMTATAAEPFVKLIADEEIAHRERKEQLSTVSTNLVTALDTVGASGKQVAALSAECSVLKGELSLLKSELAALKEGKK